MSQIAIKKLNVKCANKILVDNVHLKITKGEIFAIVGKSGSGKTMTFKGLTGLLDESKFSVTGEVYWDDKVYNPREMKQFLGHEISYVMQNPMTAFNPVFKIKSHVRETLIQHLDVTVQTADSIMIDWLQKFGLDDGKRILDSYCYELSGGMLQRIMLALAMAVDCKLIIADEPTTALDTITQKEIISEFQRLNREYKVTIVFISHDFAIVSQIADYVIVISEGAIIERGRARGVLTKPRSEETIKMLKELI